MNEHALKTYMCCKIIIVKFVLPRYRFRYRSKRYRRNCVFDLSGPWVWNKGKLNSRNRDIRASRARHGQSCHNMTRKGEWQWWMFRNSAGYWLGGYPFCDSVVEVYRVSTVHTREMGRGGRNCLQHTSVSQGRVCSDNSMCCLTEIEQHTEIELQIKLSISLQHTDTRPVNSSADPITPGVWRGSHWITNSEVTRKRSRKTS